MKLWQRIVLFAVLSLYAAVLGGQETAKKFSPPNEAAQKAAADTIAKVYKSDIDSAKTSLQKIKLAKKFLGEAVATRNDSNAKFMLLITCRDIADEQGDLATSFEAIDQIVASFEKTDAVSLKAEALSVAEEKIRRADVESALAQINLVIDDAVRADRYEIASYIAEIGIRVGKIDRNSRQSKNLVARLEDIERLKQQFKKVSDARGILEKEPGSADASFTVGWFLAVVKGEWEKAVPMLAVGSDETLRVLAIQERSENPDAVFVADSWWTVAESHNGATRDAIRAHAIEWYRRALPALTGFERTKALSRIAEKYGPPPVLLRPNGLYEKRLDCSTSHHKREMGDSFRIDDSWALSLETLIPEFEAGYHQLVCWGDDRGGFDPLCVLLEGKILYGSFDDCHRNIRAAVGVDLDESKLKTWTKVSYLYRASEAIIQLYVDDVLVAETKCEIVPFADRPMPVGIGGTSNGTQRFRGMVRNVSLGNIP